MKRILKKDCSFVLTYFKVLGLHTLFFLQLSGGSVILSGESLSFPFSQAYFASL